MSAHITPWRIWQLAYDVGPTARQPRALVGHAYIATTSGARQRGNIRKAHFPRAGSPNGDLKELPQDAKPAWLDLTKPLQFYRGRGCVKCFDLGYKGRVGIYEVLPVTSKISAAILAGANSMQLF